MVRVLLLVLQCQLQQRLLKVAFDGGTVMGMTVVGLALIGVSGLFIAFSGLMGGKRKRFSM